MFSLFEEKGTKTPAKSVVMVGRFQPPTVGHYHVIESMRKYTAKNGDGVTKMVIVIVDGTESSKDKSVNPLTADERRAFLKASGRADGITILTASNAVEAFKTAKKAGFEPVTVAAGSDRAEAYVSILDKYFKEDHTGKAITHQSLPGLTRTTSSEEGPDISKVSGSMARHAAEHGYLEEFTKLVGLESKPKLAKILFDKVKSRISKE